VSCLGFHKGFILFIHGFTHFSFCSASATSSGSPV
jgi:hypothetical protein